MAYLFCSRCERELDAPTIEQVFGVEDYSCCGKDLPMSDHKPEVLLEMYQTIQKQSKIIKMMAEKAQNSDVLIQLLEQKINLGFDKHERDIKELRE